MLPIGTQSADVYDFFDASRHTGTRQFLWQSHMGVLKCRLGAVQHGHQVHHRVMARHGGG